MYGQIHCCVRSLVLEKFGEEAWKKILETSGCDETDDFMVFHRYTDTKTLKLVGAISATLDVPVSAVLEIFGEYFFTYCLNHGYDKMLKTLGDTFESFIQNLDSLHALLAMSYKNIDAPSFRCEKVEEDVLMLHYYTSRKNLYPIVLGLLRSVGRELFNTNAKAEVVDISDEQMSQGERQHVTFRVKLTEKSDEDEKALAIKNSSSNNFQTESIFRRKGLVEPIFPNIANALISPKSFCHIFPFHVVFDKNLIIRQSGVNIQKMANYKNQENLKMTDLFNLVAPAMPLSYNHILRFINAIFIMDLIAKGKKESVITLKGQMILMEDIEHLVFIGSPRLASLNELMDRHVYLSDIPLYDCTRELVLLNQQRIAEIEISKTLDETTAELKKTANALEAEKQKTEMLLNQMLPVKVANQLREGKKVDAEKFKESTILFSDIVTFTNIAAGVQPIAIVDMLNELYSKFDELTNVHNVYKVETIGDAYMVVGGVPEREATHAQCVANFSMGMIEASREVNSPLTNKPLQIRVGIHSGSVVAGVVGDKMPRYCLFGDTVNTASRMESHGVPGRIHVSPLSYEKLKDHGYKFIDRGNMEIKGKGQMYTYFLIGNSTKQLKYNEDEFTKEIEANSKQPVDGIKEVTLIEKQNGKELNKATTQNGEPSKDKKVESKTCNVM